MSHKQGQDSHSSYMDGIKVKISEKYKPPPRINLATSYSQRLTLNKHIQDNIRNYDFSLEESVRSKMKEWRQARSMMAEERRVRFEKCREERRIREEERLKREKEIQNKIESEQELKKADNIKSQQDNAYTVLENKTDNTQNYITYRSSGNMLIPTQAITTPYSNILTPIPTPQATICQSHTTKTNDKSPFNISDFEADTSSPFDNMELKTINDLEELALVLKNDDSSYKKQSAYPAYGTQQTQYYNNYTDPNTVSMQNIQSSYAYNVNPHIPQPTKGPYGAHTIYSGTNGYYCPTDQLYNSSPYAASYSYNNSVDVNKSFDRNSPQGTSQTSDNRTFNKVPDIIKSLETELNNTHIDKMKKSVVLNDNISVVRIDVENKNSSQATKSVVEDLDDPFDTLSKELQLLSKNISSMGFPLPRVARACKIIGNDHKKIVEHLLALSDLLDLGFSEKQVSSALLQCDNDRDKALDVLIL